MLVRWSKWTQIILVLTLAIFIISPASLAQTRVIGNEDLITIEIEEADTEADLGEEGQYELTIRAAEASTGVYVIVYTLDDIEIDNVLIGDLRALETRSIVRTLPTEVDAGVYAIVYSNEFEPYELAVSISTGYDDLVYGLGAGEGGYVYDQNNFDAEQYANSFGFDIEDPQDPAGGGLVGGPAAKPEYPPIPPARGMSTSDLAYISPGVPAPTGTHYTLPVGGEDGLDVVVGFNGQLIASFGGKPTAVGADGAPLQDAAGRPVVILMGSAGSSQAAAVGAAVVSVTGNPNAATGHGSVWAAGLSGGFGFTSTAGQGGVGSNYTGTTLGVPGGYNPVTGTYQSYQISPGQYGGGVPNPQYQQAMQAAIQQASSGRITGGVGGGGLGGFGGGGRGR